MTPKSLNDNLDQQKDTTTKPVELMIGAQRIAGEGRETQKLWESNGLMTPQSHCDSLLEMEQERENSQHYNKPDNTGSEAVALLPQDDDADGKTQDSGNQSTALLDAPSWEPSAANLTSRCYVRPPRMQGKFRHLLRSSMSACLLQEGHG